jgi:hypothetical protein
MTTEDNIVSITANQYILFCGNNTFPSNTFTFPTVNFGNFVLPFNTLQQSFQIISNAFNSLNTILIPQTPEQIEQDKQARERASKLIKEGLWLRSKIYNDRWYVLKEGHHRIGVYEKKKNIGELCIIPDESYVHDDVLAAKVALLFLDEKRLCDTARWWNDHYEFPIDIPNEIET